MTRLAAAASIAVLAAVLAGCSTPTTTAKPATVQPNAQPYFAGTGVVQDVRPAPAPMIAGPASAAGPTAAAPGGMQRLTIRMDTGRVIYVDTPSKEFQKGQRVQLTESNEIRRM